MHDPIGVVIQNEGGYVNHKAEVIESCLKAAVTSIKEARVDHTVAGENVRPTTCQVASCERHAFAKDYCNAHYIRWRKGMDLSAPLQTRVKDAQCSECGEPTGSKGGWGLCAKHYMKKKAKVYKQAVVEIFGNCCSACKQTYPLPVYDFHHVGEKDESPAYLFMNGSIERIASELSRCVLLCANCHRLEHFEEEENA